MLYNANSEIWQMDRINTIVHTRVGLTAKKEINIMTGNNTCFSPLYLRHEQMDRIYMEQLMRV